MKRRQNDFLNGKFYRGGNTDTLKMKGLMTALILVIAVFFNLVTVPVHAENAGSSSAPTYTITINETGDGHSYNAYQIFAGDVSEKDGNKILSNVTAGSGLKQDTGTNPNKSLVNALKADSKLKSKNGIKDLTESASAADIAEAIETANLSGDEQTALAKVLNKHKTDTATATSVRKTDNTGYEISNLPAGYYLVVDGKDSDAATGTPSEYSSLILQVAGNVQVDPKTGTPQIVKKVYDSDYNQDDSVSLGGKTIELGQGYNDVTDAAVADLIEFEVFATLPDNYDDYEHYYYAIEDTMDESLEPVYSGESNIELNLPSNVGPNGETAENGIYNVFAQVAGEQSYYSVEFKNPEDSKWQEISKSTITKDPGGQSGKVYLYWFNPSENPLENRILLVFPDLKKISGITKDSVIKFSYTAVLNGKARTGNNQGNINRVKLFYSNNPENPGDGNYPPHDMGHTPEDVNAVFTYGIDMSKISSVKDSNRNDINLKGATFALSAFYDRNSGMIVDDTSANLSDVIKVYMLFSADETEAIKDNGAVYPQYLDIFDSDPTADETPEEVGPWYSVGNKGYGTRIFSVWNDGKIKIKGLNAETYYLEEVKAPDGYNKLTDPVKIVISPTVVNTQNYINATTDSNTDTLKTGNPEVLTALNGQVYPKKDITGKYVEDTGIAELDTQNTNAASGYVTVKVKNKPGSVLPQTGGTGTRLFYGIGSCLIAGAVILLMMRKKNSSEKEI